MKSLFLVILVAYLFFYIVFAIKSGEFKKSVMRTCFLGPVLLIGLHILGCYLGFKLPLNIFTISFSAFTGLPGVLLIALLDFIFI